jgi:hypothetical protein
MRPVPISRCGVIRALVLSLVTVSCASDYSRRVAPANDPANPSAASAAAPAVTLYEPGAEDAADAGVTAPPKATP